MTFIASTLTEQLHHEGKEIGIKIGQKTGEKIGRIRGAIVNLQDLFDQGLIPVEIYESRIANLKQDLEKIRRK